MNKSNDVILNKQVILTNFNASLYIKNQSRDYFKYIYYVSNWLNKIRIKSKLYAACKKITGKSDFVL